MEIGVVDQALTRALRRAVLRPELSPNDPLPGDDVPDAVHFAALSPTGEALSTCFVFPAPCPWQPERAGAWQMRQMATQPACRGQGIGGAVLTAVAEHLTAAGAPLAWCQARLVAVPFYEHHGWLAHGAVYQHIGMPHRDMWLELSGPTSARP
ncbi:MAG: GNAT family N-acetyltransferase [Actinomycetia bacterium]|nr:GNAT family N-acetyltransferase [Actinomycetes bacterium]